MVDRWPTSWTASRSERRARSRRVLFRAGLLAALALGLGCDRTPEVPNVVLVSIDTLRPDHLACYGYTRPTSPTIDSLAACGVRFVSTTAQSPWTLPSHVTLLSSTLPFTHGVVDDNCRIPGDLPMLPQILGEHGYACAGFVSSFYVGRTFGFERGFDRFEDFGTDIHGQFFPGHKVLGETVTAEGIEWLRGAGEPFFLFLHYYDAHINYAVPEPYARLFEDPDRAPDLVYQSYEHYKHDPLTPAEQRHVVAQYDAAVAYVDANIRRVLDSLKDLRVSDRTLVVITSDHGEEFFERGSWGHAYTLYDEALRIPLVWMDPRDASPAGAVEAPARLVDLAPTLLDLVGLPPAPGMQGQSLRPLLAGSSGSGDDPLEMAETSRQNVNLTSLRKGRLKLIADWNENRRELYDLHSDPGERVDLAAADTSLARDLLDEAVRVGASLIPGRIHVRWRTADRPRAYSGTLRSLGVFVDVDARGLADGDVRLDEDRHTLEFSSDRAGELWVAVVPVDASVVFDLRIDGQTPVGSLFVGAGALVPDERPFVLAGVPRSPELLRPPPDRGPGFYVWKDPGDRTVAPPVDLSEEAKEHLRSLGYLH